MTHIGGVRLARAAIVVTLLAGAAGTAPAFGGAAASGTASKASAPSTVWLCRPGETPDPCLSSRAATAVAADGTSTPIKSVGAKNPPIDCFYVYPTVSDEPTENANLAIQPAETGVAVDQASRFSQVCKVYAPMYRQLTLASITGKAPLTEAGEVLAYTSALAGFEDYLKHYNHGRGIVFIGHSQGAGIVIELLMHKVDDNPALRKRLVSAIILGGNVSVPIGKSVGGDFKHIPACRSKSEIGCVMAYSSFLQAPPPNTLFGIVGQGVSVLSGQPKNPNYQVLCTNPAALGGGSAPLSSYFLSGRTSVKTPWVTYPGLYTGQCKTANGATWLQVTPRPGDTRPEVAQVLGPNWGLHLDDVNMTLGNLVSVVAAETKAYTGHH